MALVHWAPFEEMDSLQREMNRLIDTLAPNMNGNVDQISFKPAAEIYETPDAIQLRVELPGVEAQDLDIQVTAEAVSISGERKNAVQAEEKGTVRSEFRYGKFRRIIQLPVRVQNSQVTAEYKEGILRLSLPKTEAEKHKVVKVSLG